HRHRLPFTCPPPTEACTLSLHDALPIYTGRSVPGRVVRAYPELDLAFVQVDIQVSNLLPVAPQFYLPDDARLTAVAHNGKVMSRSEEHTSELQSRENLVCRLPLEKKKQT